MKALVILVVVALVAALRLAWRQRCRAGRVRSARDGLGPFTSEVGLVMSREIHERIRGKIFRAGTVLILVVVAAAILAPKLHSGTSITTERVGVVGGLSASMRSVVQSSARANGAMARFVEERDSASARSSLRKGHVDFVVVNGEQLLIPRAFDAGDTSITAQLVSAVALRLAEVRALQVAQLSPEQKHLLTSIKPLPVASLQAGNATSVSATSIIGLVVLFIMLTQYNTWILLGVMEEKSSRVVEVLLGAVKPIQLLSGKVLGIGVVAMAQATLVVLFALALARAVGSSLLHGSATIQLLSSLLWLVLGFAFYCWVYAAAGSMAERQDQVQSLALPLSLPILVGYITSITAASSGHPAAWFKVLAYLPPFAPFAMPVLVGFGVVTWWQFLLSVLVSVAATVGVARVAANVYRRAILRNGRRVKLRDVLARSTR